MTRGHRLQDIVDAGLAPSVRWLQDGIRARRIPAHKIGRHWVMTDGDIERLLEITASVPQQREEAPTALSLTVTSRRRAS